MSSTYKGNSNNVIPGVPLSITVPSDGDVCSAASVNSPGPFEPSADFAQYVYEQLQAMALVNLTDAGQVNSMTICYDVIWVSSLGLWVAVGATSSAGAISTSPDGKTWTSRFTSAGNQPLTSVAWNGTTLVAVGKGVSASPIVVTSTNGTSWSLASGPGGFASATQVAWDATIGLFVLVEDNGHYSTSSNGTTWTAGTTVIGSATAMWGICSNGAGTFLAVGTDGTHCVWTSTNGTTWTAQAIAGLSATALACAYSSTLSAFLVLDNSGTGKTALSSNSGGTAWNAAISTAVACSTTTYGAALKWVGRAFALTSSSAGTYLQYSVAGTAWRAHIPPAFVNGGITPWGMGANSDTGQVLVGGSANGHIYSSLAQPAL